MMQTVLDICELYIEVLYEVIKQKYTIETIDYEFSYDETLMKQATRSIENLRQKYTLQAMTSIYKYKFDLY